MENTNKQSAPNMPHDWVACRLRRVPAKNDGKLMFAKCNMEKRTQFPISQSAAISYGGFTALPAYIITPADGIKRKFFKNEGPKPNFVQSLAA